MRILLDESMPRKLKFCTARPLCAHGAAHGLERLGQRQTLAAAAGEFNVLITGDGNMQYQQSASQLPVAVVVLIAPNHKLESFFAVGG
jgi:glycerate kinase